MFLFMVERSGCYNTDLVLGNRLRSLSVSNRRNLGKTTIYESSDVAGFTDPRMAMSCGIARTIHVFTRATFRYLFGAGLEKDFYTGRVYEFLSRHDDIEPRKPHRFLHAEPVLDRDVSDLGPNESISLSLSDPGVLRFPRDLKEKDLEGLYVQAVVRFHCGIATTGRLMYKLQFIGKNTIFIDILKRIGHGFRISFMGEYTSMLTT